MSGQMRMTTANAIANAPRSAVVFQMWASARSPSCSCVSRFMSCSFQFNVADSSVGLVFELVASRA